MPWRDVPDRYGRWQRDGTRARILLGLQARADAAGLITWDVSVDTTIARAHQHAAGARKRGSRQSRSGHPAHQRRASGLRAGWVAGFS